MTIDSEFASTQSSSPEAIKEVEILCAAFESAWQEGRSPGIREFLLQTQFAPAETVLVELVKLDLYYRARIGELPALSDYETQFPEYTATLQNLQSHLQTQIYQRQEIDQYRLIRAVGRGGFGEVWEAFDTQLKRRVAIKIPRERNPDPVQRKMLLREAQAAAQLDHPRVTKIYGFSDAVGKTYIASEFVDGPTLGKWIRWHEVAPQEAARICMEIAEGLHAAHTAKIVHRDLKPGNVLMCDGVGGFIGVDLGGGGASSTKVLHPKIVDFGLAKNLDGDSTIGGDNAVMGTFAYMSPEQARGQSDEIDGRTDIYALGAILYELITNRVMFKGTYTEVLNQIVHRDPTAPRTLNRAIPLDLETICLKATRKIPGERYQSAKEMAEDLSRFLADEPVLARRQNKLQKLWRRMRKNWALTSVIALGAVLAAAASGSAYREYDSYVKERVLVSIDTVPAGADVVFVPLHPVTGSPVPEEKVNAGKSPVKQLLLPGDYLVVAHNQADFFHEVYRHVPGRDESGWVPGIHRHQRWISPQEGHFVLPAVTLFHQSQTLGHMVSAKDDSAAFLDETELTIADHIRLQGRIVDREGKVLKPNGAGCAAELPDGYAARCISFDEAMQIAEKVGKRLPSLSEYQEFCSASEGAWAIPELDFQLDVTSGDVIETESRGRIQGLLSNVAEWVIVDSPLQVAPLSGTSSSPDTGSIRPGYFREKDQRAVFGPLTSGWAQNPGGVSFFSRNTWQSQIGMRCARSAQPRFVDEE